MIRAAKSGAQAAANLPELTLQPIPHILADLSADPFASPTRMTAPGQPDHMSSCGLSAQDEMAPVKADAPATSESQLYLSGQLSQALEDPKSDYHVGDKAPSASHHVARPAAAVLQDVFYWIASYADLWQRPCSETGVLLAADHGSCQLLPPTVRPYWLTSQQLKTAATDRSQRKAYHSLSVPACLPQAH